MKPTFAMSLTLIGVLSLSACTNVKPWQRGMLAEQAMLINANPVEQGLDDHTYFSKEAANGGNAIGGGGCGCN